MKIITKIIIIITIILSAISCEEDSDWIESDNFGVILDTLTYSTIQEAINEATDGDTLFLTEGIFADAGDKNLTWDGNEKHLTITIVEEANAIIECNGKGNGFVFNCTHQNTSDVIDGIIIRSSGDFDDAGIYCEWTSPTIKNCTISDCGWCGIYCDNAAPILENNTIYENEVGIMCANGSIPLIRWNIIEKNKSDGIFSNNDSYPSIINNLIIQNRRDGIYCLNGSGVMVNNTIADNKNSGINYDTDTPTTIINSIIWGNGKGFEPENINITVSYSCAQDSIPSVNPYSLGNIYSKPCFVLPENYHLASKSPCINKGNNDVVDWDYDLDGNPRIFDEKVDMGCYEWQP